MDVIDIQKDYVWTLKVLDSCTSIGQISTTEKVFENFLKKWIDIISDERSMSFENNFKRYVSQKKRTLKKNLVD